jgi:hypothetical protein
VIDQATAGERGQDPRDRAHVDPGPAGNLVGAQLDPRGRELVEDDDRTLDGGNLTGGWPTSPCHDTIFPIGNSISLWAIVAEAALRAPAGVTVRHRESGRHK